MSKILDLYVDIKESNQRFIYEIFIEEIYRAVCPQLTIIDAGAYEGEFSFYCYNFAKKIYAFEPDPKPWEVLSRRHRDFELGDRIEIFNTALSGKTGKRIFHASGGGGSRLLGEEISDYPEKERIKVQSISLADFIKDKNIEQVDILKIDVENGENEIFRAPEFAQISNKIKTIIGEHLSGVKGLLESLGYKSRVVEGMNTLYERN